MDAKTIEILKKATSDFYQSQCDSFSITRSHAWHGWELYLPILETIWQDDRDFSVFDLACGNLRLEQFLLSKFPDSKIDFYAVDNCDDLAATADILAHVNYQSLDVLEVLNEGIPINEQFKAPQCDLSVCFGFMHHVPTMKYREEILRALVNQTRPGGYVVVTFWQFLKSDSLRKKAEATLERGLDELGLDELEQGDYLLGWKDTVGSYRYCHSFSEDEIDALVASVADRAQVVARFEADGKTDNLNTYLVLRVD